MRLAACLAICLMPTMASTAQEGDQGPANPGAYCVDGSAAFYRYTGEPCKTGYELGLGNCRTTSGRMVAAPREQCVGTGGTIELPFERGIVPPKPPRLKQ